MVAHYTAKHFIDHLSGELPKDHTAPDFTSKAQLAFETALMSLDAELKGLSIVESGQDQSGSTSVMTLVSPRSAATKCLWPRESRCAFGERKGLGLTCSFRRRVPSLRPPCAMSSVPLRRASGLSTCVLSCLISRGEAPDPTVSSCTSLRCAFDRASQGAGVTSNALLPP
eukprot:6174660-Pleurochrysis_carterae.AAC.1